MTGRKHLRGFRRSALGGVALLLLALLVACAASQGEIDVGTALATANATVKGSLNPPARFVPHRVRIGTERDAEIVRRCLEDDDPGSPGSAVARSLGQKIAQRKFYVVDYPVLLADDHDGMEWEPCVFVDRATGEALGMIVH